MHENQTNMMVTGHGFISITMIQDVMNVEKQSLILSIKL